MHRDSRVSINDCFTYSFILKVTKLLTLYLRDVIYENSLSLLLVFCWHNIHSQLDNLCKKSVLFCNFIVIVSWNIVLSWNSFVPSLEICLKQVLLIFSDQHRVAGAQLPSCLPRAHPQPASPQAGLQFQGSRFWDSTTAFGSLRSGEYCENPKTEHLITKLVRSSNVPVLQYSATANRTTMTWIPDF